MDVYTFDARLVIEAKSEDQAINAILEHCEEGGMCCFLTKAGALNNRKTLAHLNALHDRIEAKQSQIDMLMLEYCPEEMTTKQRARWAKNQAEED